MNIIKYISGHDLNCFTLLDWLKKAYLSFHTVKVFITFRTNVREKSLNFMYLYDTND